MSIVKVAGLIEYVYGIGEQEVDEKDNEREGGGRVASMEWKSERAWRWRLGCFASVTEQVYINGCGLHDSHRYEHTCSGQNREEI